MAPLGCPVFTERKGPSFALVASVAAKAITVARGYIENEHTGHTVGFQPSLSHAVPGEMCSGHAVPLLWGA